jgi:hypothetical protein
MRHAVRAGWFTGALALTLAACAKGAPASSAAPDARSEAAAPGSPVSEAAADAGANAAAGGELERWIAELETYERALADAELRSPAIRGGAVRPPAGDAGDGLAGPRDTAERTKDAKAGAALDESSAGGPSPTAGAAATPTAAIDAGDRCARACDLATATCGLRARICELASTHAGDPRYVASCERATRACDRAQEVCGGCNP